MAENGLSPQERFNKDYEKIANWEKASGKVQKDIQNVLHATKKDVIGVFGSYGHVFSDCVRVEDAIEFLAKQIAERNPGCFVITGKTLYTYNEHDHEVKQTDILQKELSDAIRRGEINWDHYNEILAAVSTMAVFFLNFSGRSSSAIEEITFCKDHRHANSLGLGVLVVEQGFKPCNCFRTTERKLSDKTKYHICEEIVGPGCSDGSFHLVGHTFLSMFLARSYIKVVATTSWKYALEIFEQIKSISSIGKK